MKGNATYLADDIASLTIQANAPDISVQVTLVGSEDIIHVHLHRKLRRKDE